MLPSSKRSNISCSDHLDPIPPLLLYIKHLFHFNKQFSIDSFLDWEGLNWDFSSTITSSPVSVPNRIYSDAEATNALPFYLFWISNWENQKSRWEIPLLFAFNKKRKMNIIQNQMKLNLLWPYNIYFEFWPYKCIYVLCRYWQYMNGEYLKQHEYP